MGDEKALATKSNFRRTIEAWRVWWCAFAKGHNTVDPKSNVACNKNSTLPCFGAVQCEFHKDLSRQGRLVRCGCDEHYPFKSSSGQEQGSCTACEENLASIEPFDKNRRNVQRSLGMTMDSSDVMPVCRELSTNEDMPFKVWDELVGNKSGRRIEVGSVKAYVTELFAATENVRQCPVYQIEKRDCVCLYAALSLTSLFPFVSTVGAQTNLLKAQEWFERATSPEPVERPLKRSKSASNTPQSPYDIADSKKERTFVEGEDAGGASSSSSPGANRASVVLSVSHGVPGVTKMEEGAAEDENFDTNMCGTCSSAIFYDKLAKCCGSDKVCELSVMCNYHLSLCAHSVVVDTVELPSSRPQILGLEGM